MCDYCTCHEQEAIGALAREHDDLLSLASDVRSALSRDDVEVAEARLSELVELLAPHVTREERGLFPELDGRVNALLDDHAWVRDRIEELADGGCDRTTRRTMTVELLDELAAHIAVEEYDLFPAALLELSPDAWERVAAGVARVG